MTVTNYTSNQPVNMNYSLLTPQLFKITNSSDPQNQFIFENRQFNSTMQLGSNTCADYNQYLPHGSQNDGILVWRRWKISSSWYVSMVHASGEKWASTSIHGNEGDIFPGSFQKYCIGPTSDTRIPTQTDADGQYQYWVPNTKPSTNIGMEIIDKPSYYRVYLYCNNPPTTAGPINQNETWNNYVTITDNITVNSAVTLQIQPGTKVRGYAGKQLIVNGTLSANGSTGNITFTRSGTTGTWGGIQLNNSASGSTITKCIVNYADRGIYENGVSVNIRKSAISNCTNGIYLYSSSLTIDSCNIHDNTIGIYSVSSPIPILYNNYIRNNTSIGIDCLSGSNLKLGSGSTHGKNDITGNNNGIFCYNNSSPVLGKSSDGGYNNLGNNTASNVYSFSSSGIYAINNYWGTGGYKIYGTGSVVYLPSLSSPETVPIPPLSKTGDNIYFSSGNDIPLITVLDKAFQLVADKKLLEARQVCLELINNYPDYSVSYNALNLLKETYSDKEIADKKNIYKSLFKSKVKKNIYAMAGLILSDIDKENRLKQIEEVINDYKGESVVELALFDKFVYYYFELNDKENSRAISNELDELFPISQGAIEAHRILGDEEYFSIYPEEQIIKKNTQSTTPTVYTLYDNYPNPFNPTTTINFQIPEEGLVTLKVYDILGREVASLVNEDKKAGYYTYNFDASKLSSGVYIYKITANNFVQSKKMLLLK